ncbi:MAG: DnaJ C-terminal domain-containing protein [Myxococcota bacterium]
MSLNPYTVLGVRKSDDEATLKKAYKRLARKYHPDVSKEPDADRKFKEVNEAWDILKDPQKRKMFDTFGRTDGPPPGRGGGGFGGRGGFQGGGFGGFGGGAGGVDVEDLLSSMFGAGTTGGGFNRQSRGRDQKTTMKLDFMLSVLGGETTVVVGRPGGGRESIKVRIPAGVDSGKSLRLRGKGLPPPGGGPAGDLQIDLEVASHPFLRRQGTDLHMDVPITVGEAINGAKIVVPTPTGDVNVKVPPGTATGTKLRLRGRGVQTKTKPGDLYLVLRPTLPSELTDEAQHEAVQTLEAAYTTPVREGLKL